jgi:transaldolase
MKKRNYTRFYNRWRNDSDYINQLPPDAKEWLQTFIGEFYQGNTPTLHPDKYRKQLHDSYHSAANDIVTAPSSVVENQVKHINKQFHKSKNPSEINRWYHPEEYPLISTDTDEEVVEIVRPKGTK